jgi:hypothetical protein
MSAFVFDIPRERKIPDPVEHGIEIIALTHADPRWGSRYLL